MNTKKFVKHLNGLFEASKKRSLWFSCLFILSPWLWPMIKRVLINGDSINVFFLEIVRNAPWLVCQSHPFYILRLIRLLLSFERTFKQRLRLESWHMLIGHLSTFPLPKTNRSARRFDGNFTRTVPNPDHKELRMEISDHPYRKYAITIPLPPNTPLNPQP